MLRNHYAVLAGLVLLSHSASAVQADQQWGDWYGNISAMEFELNTQNISGEVLTLTCTSGKLAAAYSVPTENYRVSSVSMVRTILWMKRPLLR